MSKHRDVNITVSESGSGNGAKSLINGTCDVANMSRFMKEKEFAAAAEKGIMPVAHVVARVTNASSTTDLNLVPRSWRRMCRSAPTWGPSVPNASVGPVDSTPRKPCEGVTGPLAPATMRAWNTGGSSASPAGSPVAVEAETSPDRSWTLWGTRSIRSRRCRHRCSSASRSWASSASSSSVAEGPGYSSAGASREASERGSTAQRSSMRSRTSRISSLRAFFRGNS